MFFSIRAHPLSSFIYTSQLSPPSHSSFEWVINDASDLWFHFLKCSFLDGDGIEKCRLSFSIHSFDLFHGDRDEKYLHSSTFHDQQILLHHCKHVHKLHPQFSCTIHVHNKRNVRKKGKSWISNIDWESQTQDMILKSFIGTRITRHVLMTSRTNFSTPGKRKNNQLGTCEVLTTLMKNIS